MLNIVAVMGRLVADPVMRQTQSGKSVASFTVACDRGRKDADGTYPTDFFDIVVWGNTAEFVCKYFTKGSLIALDGRLQTRSYQDKNGNNRKAFEIVASNVSFAGAKSTGTAQGKAPDISPSAPASASNNDFAVIEDSDDLPF